MTTESTIFHNEDIYYSHAYFMKSGLTRLMQLVVCADRYPVVEFIKKILRESPDEIDKKNNKQQTALILACSGSHTSSNTETNRILLDANADVNLQDKNGKTALMIACDANETINTDVVELLLSRDDIDVDLQNNYGNTALMLFASNINNKMLPSNIIIDNEKYKETFELLILKSLRSINFKDKIGFTAYEWYIAGESNILDEYFLSLLRGDKILDNTCRG